MWGFLKRMLGGTEKPSQTTEEGERSDIRRPAEISGGEVEKPSQTLEERKRSDIRRPGGIPSGKAEKASQTTEERKRSDIRSPGGNGESRVADTLAAAPVMGDDDHLGKAAVARQAARQAIKDKRYDDAWRHLHEQQSEWLKDSAKRGSSVKQTLSLLSSIHEDMANVLRLEGKHDQALANILYCVATNSRLTQAQEKKLISYFRRCKFGDQYGEDRVEAAVKMLRHEPDYRMAQEIVSQWRNGTAPPSSRPQ